MPEITTREMEMINDQLDIIQIYLKKFNSYVSMTQDPELKTQYEKLAAQHKRHFDMLLRFLSN